MIKSYTILITVIFPLLKDIAFLSFFLSKKKKRIAGYWICTLYIFGSLYRISCTKEETISGFFFFKSSDRNKIQKKYLHYRKEEDSDIRKICMFLKNTFFYRMLKIVLRG